MVRRPHNTKEKLQGPVRRPKRSAHPRADVCLMLLFTRWAMARRASTAWRATACVSRSPGPMTTTCWRLGGTPRRASLERRHHDAAAAAGLDAPPGVPCGGLLPHSRGPRSQENNEGRPPQTVREKARALLLVRRAPSFFGCKPCLKEHATAGLQQACPLSGWQDTNLGSARKLRNLEALNRPSSVYFEGAHFLPLSGTISTFS
jgi:hypothetical protein